MGRPLRPHMFSLNTVSDRVVFACVLGLVAFILLGRTSYWKDSLSNARNHVRDGDAQRVVEMVRKSPSLVTARHHWDQSTLLHTACVNVQRREMVVTLLNLGFDPNAQDDLGRTPLHLAFIFDAEQTIVDLLISAGADPNAIDVKGKRPQGYLEP
jgi:hypothetical protein